MWEDFASAVATCAEGCYVKVQGQVAKYQGKYQITLTKMRLAAASEIDTADFVPTTQFDIGEMWAELRGYVEEFQNADLRRLVFAFLDDEAIGAAYREAPAAKVLHHAWIGGLLEHVLTLVRVCRATAPFYPEVDRDLLVTGAILHDIGKVRELSWGTTLQLHAGRPDDRAHLHRAGNAAREDCHAARFPGEAAGAGGAHDPEPPRQV